MAILDHPLIGERYFFPRAGPLDGATVVQVDGAELACLHHAPHPGAPTVLHFHGNGEVVADYVPDVVKQFEEIGLNVFFAEYRGYGASSGEPQLGRMLDDVAPIFARLKGPVIAFGRSVGSLFAVELVHRHPEISALILESGIADPLERLTLRVTPEELGVTEEALRAEVAARLDHEKKLGAYMGALLVLHTKNDGLVDVSHAERNHDWSASKNKRLVVFDRGDHNTIMGYNWDAYWSSVTRLARA